MNNQLTLFLEELKTDLIHSMQANGSAPGAQTLSQLNVVTEGDKAQLQIPGFIAALENGRGPTGKNVAPAVPPMIQRIKQWCIEKGIPEREAWAIKKTIDKQGVKGKPGILSEPLGEANISLRLQTVMESLANDLLAQIRVFVK
ncbi:MAG: hypothetical protein ACXVJD_18545 [Mucilaginibacter sp.]